MSEDVALKNACRHDRQFQDKKLKELKLVHDVLQDTDMSDDEKVCALLTDGKFGWERAQVLVYGHIKYKKKLEQQDYVKEIGRLR